MNRSHAGRVVFVVLASLIVSACGTAPPGALQSGPLPSPESSTSALPEPSTTASIDPSPTSKETASPAYATYSDPKGRFSFQYPASLKLTPPDPNSASYTVYVDNYEPTESSIAAGWAGRTSLQVFIRDGENWESLDGSRPTKVDGRDASFVIRRTGDPSFENHEEGLRLVASSLLVTQQWGFSIVVYSGETSTTSAEKLFWDVLNSFKLNY